VYFIGFDIGGSSVKAVLVKNRKIIKSHYEKLPANFNELVECVVALKKRMADSRKIKGIGISVAGVLDKKRKKMLRSFNIPYLNERPLRSVFVKALNSDVVVERDLPCFVIAEQRAGLAKKYRNIFYLTLGTGIGGAFTIDGKIIKGSHGAAGEAGHSIVDFKNRIRWEDIAANKYIRKKLKVSFTEAKRRALKGDKKTLQIFKELGSNLGVGIANIINIFNPEVIMLSGGLASARKFFLPEVKAEIKKFVISREARKTKILWSKLGRFGGALGAALLFENKK